MKNLDITVWALLIIGGINWGLVGVFNVNLVAALFGEMSAITRIIYALVGIAAVYDVVMIKAIWKRWHFSYGTASHA